MKRHWIFCSIIPLLIGGIGTLAAQENLPQQQAPKTKIPPTEYVAKDYSYLFGMPGFSDPLLKMHFQLYQGYVKNTNLLLSRLKELQLQIAISLMTMAP